MDTKKAYYDIKETPTWYVDKIPAFCINLERRPDRWAEFTAQPGVQQLPNVKRFLAVDGSTIDYMTDPRIPMYTKKNIKNTKPKDFRQQDAELIVRPAISLAPEPEKPKPIDSWCFKLKYTIMSKHLRIACPLLLHLHRRLFFEIDNSHELI